MLQNEKVFHVNFQRYCNSKWIDLIFNPRSIRFNLKYSRKGKIFVLIGYLPLKKNLRRVIHFLIGPFLIPVTRALAQEYVR